MKKLGFDSYTEAIERSTFDELSARARRELEDEEERRCLLHVAGEAFRVQEAVAALRRGDADAFGKALNASHDSLRDLLRVSCPALDELVDTARGAGATGARLTGAGFGGCAVIFCKRSQRDRIAAEIAARFYAGKGGFDPDAHLVPTEPSAGALHSSE
jgi:galactokinase